MFNKKIAFASLFLLMSILACQTPSVRDGDASGMNTYLQMRKVWFKTTPEYLQVAYEPESKVPYAILMDMGVDADVVTIAGSIVGDGSLLTSNGGGVIGGVEHENVRKASMHFVEVAGQFVDGMKLTTAFPLPSPGYARFYAVTPSGVYMTESIKIDDLTLGSHKLSPLYLAGDAVITELRLASDG